MSRIIDERSLSKKFTELNNTQQSIQTLSLWLIHYRKKSKLVVEVWYKEVLKQKDPRKLTNLFYLANDVIQNSRRKGNEYVDDFAFVMEKAIVQMCICGDDKSIKPLRRILAIWEDRGVYKKDFIEKLLRSAKSNLSGSQLRIFNTRPTDTKSKKGRDKDDKKQENRTFSPSPIDDAEPSTSRESGPYSPQQSPEPGNVQQGAEDALFPSRLSPRESPVEPPSTEQLLSLIRQLEDAPSTDAVVRQDIATLPSDVADVNKLDQISSRRAAETLSEVVDRADILLEAYNKRLAQELEQRQFMLRNLGAYINAQNDRMGSDQQILEQWQSKLAKLGQDRKDLKSHVDSLPDLKNLKEPLAPLPTLGELFTKI